jgi:hypothetical protein
MQYVYRLLVTVLTVTSSRLASNRGRPSERKRTLK